jgi:hypothetical protein
LRQRDFTAFPHPEHVTSNLALHKKKADHGQGVSGTSFPGENTHKFFVIKILTSNPLRLKILQSIFANPAPVKAFSGWGGGGTPLTQDVSQNETRPNAPDKPSLPTIFSGNSHSAARRNAERAECTQG